MGLFSRKTAEEKRQEQKAEKERNEKDNAKYVICPHCDKKITDGETPSQLWSDHYRTCLIGCPNPLLAIP